MWEFKYSNGENGLSAALFLLGRGDDMQQQILMISSDLTSCKKLKYSLQDGLTRVYYTLSVDHGIQHLIHYSYHIIILHVTCMSTDVMRPLSLLRKACLTPILVLSPETDADPL